MTRRRSRALRATRRTITDNLGLKLASIAAAVALFWVVRGTEDAERSLFVEVVPLLPKRSADRILVSELPDRVKLTVRGSRSILETLDSDTVPPVEIDLRDTSRNYYYFEPDAFELPAAVELVRMAPASLQLEWASRLERRLPVHATLSGSPGPDLEARPIRVQPDTVVASGPHREVSRLDAVATAPVDVSDLARGTSEHRVPLEEAPKSTRFDHRRATVTIEVAARQAHRELKKVEVVLEGTQAATLRPAEVDVRLWGPSSVLADLDADRIVPTLELEGVDLSEQSHEVRVQLRGVPSNVQARAVPARVVASGPDDSPAIEPRNVD